MCFGWVCFAALRTVELNYIITPQLGRGPLIAVLDCARGQDGKTVLPAARESSKIGCACDVSKANGRLLCAASSETAADTVAQPDVCIIKRMDDAWTAGTAC